MRALKQQLGLIDGAPVHEAVLEVAGGTRVAICEFGATITSVMACDRGGVREELTLGQSLEDLQKSPGYFGSTVGRFANRIKNGTFQLDGKIYRLAVNNGENHLHGGEVGFDKRLWSISSEPIVAPDNESASVRFALLSAAGEEGYPGQLQVEVTFTLAINNQLTVDYEATTDEACPVNLTNHAYWNLSGGFKRTLRTHRLSMWSDYYIPVDAGSLIPTGDISPVFGTPFDLRPVEPSAPGHLLGPRLPLVGKMGHIFGYDHCFVVDTSGGGRVDDSNPAAPPVYRAASLCDLESGRRLTIWTSQPGVQVYTGNFLSPDPRRHPFTQHNAVCLETQHFPDSPNQPSFPSCIVKAGEVYRHRSIYALDIVDEV